MQDVLDKVKELEDQVDRLKEESEARQKLSITREEAAQKEEEILTAVDKEEYTLTKEKSIDFQYTFEYAYASSDRLQLGIEDVTGEHQYNHSMEHKISVYYGLLNNLTLNTGIPFIYRYYDIGGSSSKDVTDIGDITLGFGLRPFKTSGAMPNISVSGSVTLPTGRSPYKIDINKEISTGSGLYSTGLGLSLSKAIDPVIAYGSLSYSHSFERTDLYQNLSPGLVLTGVEPGDSIGLSIGMAFPLSYQSSMNLGFSYSYGFSTTYHYKNLPDAESSIGTSSSISIGTGWRISPKTTISVGLGIGLTGSDNFTLSVRVPFSL
ncbi:MAG: transporter [Deltaproteobacteria bacterium]|nr:transporter [Deltaproteobacteria bacterium]